MLAQLLHGNHGPLLAAFSVACWAWSGYLTVVTMPLACGDALRELDAVLDREIS